LFLPLELTENDKENVENVETLRNSFFNCGSGLIVSVATQVHDINLKASDYL